MLTIDFSNIFNLQILKETEQLLFCLILVIVPLQPSANGLKYVTNKLVKLYCFLFDHFSKSQLLKKRLINKRLSNLEVLSVRSHFESEILKATV